MKSEKQHLIHDLLGGETRRAATLLACGRTLRRRRHWRVARRSFALAMVAVVAVLWLHQKESPQPALQASATGPTKASTPIQAQSLTDDELLALFPNTPVGLATLSDGKKRLLFLRAGDEQKFITRL